MCSSGASDLLAREDEKQRQKTSAAQPKVEEDVQCKQREASGEGKTGGEVDVPRKEASAAESGLSGRQHEEDGKDELRRERETKENNAESPGYFEVVGAYWKDWS